MPSLPFTCDDKLEGSEKSRMLQASMLSKSGGVGTCLYNIVSVMHYCSIFLFFLAFCPNEGVVWAQVRAIMDQVLAPFHNLLPNSCKTPCFLSLIPASVFSLSPPLILFPPPQTVFRRVKSISAVISVMSCCAVCMCECVMRRSFISSFISRPAPSSPGLLLSLFIFPILSHTGPHMLSFSHTLPSNAPARTSVAH